MSPSAARPRDRVAVWISGASSGIGAALAGSVPFHRGRGLGQGVLASALRRRPDWDAWLGERSEELKPAPKRLGNRDHKAHPKAPGSYVLAH